MEIDILTREDLRQFKQEMLEEIRKLKENGQKGSNEKEWLKSADVRRLLDISPGTLQNLRINGTLPFRKIGGSMYYRAADVKKMMEGGNGNG
uniref:Putative DNA-binding protein n=1 Tax=Sphingobacterium sp. (strain 21) TaxID=743722 RepID=F4CEJ3_SPHS2